MTTNIWINKVMQDIDNFCGVYSSDNMKDPMSYPTYLIVKFSPSFKRGTHLIAMIFDEEQNCTYFDPLGLGTMPKTIEDFMKKNPKMLKKFIVQSNAPFQVFVDFIVCWL